MSFSFNGRALVQAQPQVEDVDPDEAGAESAVFLKWSGGKRRMLPAFSPHFPAALTTGRFFEPMCGAGALALDWADRWQGGVFIADMNEALIELYCGVRDQPTKLLERVRQLADEFNTIARRWSTLLPRNDWYLDHRVKFDHAIGLERSALLLILNRLCFNGLYRVNRDGGFNSPFNSAKSVPFELLRRRVWAASEILRRSDVSINCGDFENCTLEHVGAGDFVYFDPPFDGTYGAYTTAGFKQDDQVRLRDVADELVGRGATVYVSNSDTELIRDLYGEFDIISVPNRRSISCKADGRVNGHELLIVMRTK